MLVFAITRDHETRFDKAGGRGKRSKKRGFGEGKEEGGRIWRIVRPETSTHYTENVTNGKVGADMTEQGPSGKQKDR